MSLAKVIYMCMQLDMSIPGEYLGDVTLYYSYRPLKGKLSKAKAN
jgi:hypothetical protein